MAATIPFDARSLGIDADQIVPRLWVGSAPADTDNMTPFDRVVFCAREYQPDPKRWQGKAIHAGFEDEMPISRRSREVAAQAAALVVIHHRAHERLLVTCRAGVNRSALVVALAMLQLAPTVTAAEVIARIRQRRQLPDDVKEFHPYALFNPAFVEFIESTAAAR